jgi:hypothetical protein
MGHVLVKDIMSMHLWICGGVYGACFGERYHVNAFVDLWRCFRDG